jgi:hypothetical protein
VREYASKRRIAPLPIALDVLQVWRDGQKKRVFVYRFLATGSIEEKVYQRQLSKEGLKQLVSKSGACACGPSEQPI